MRKIRPEPASNGCDTLFLSHHGIAITANAIKLTFSRLSAKSGVNKLHAHLCRHTFAINYLLNGGDIFSLKEILGHTTLEIPGLRLQSSTGNSPLWISCLTTDEM